MKIGVVLLNMGGPDRVEDVPAYLGNIFRDPAILEIPLGFLVRPWLSRIIVKKRAGESAARYARIGGKTPLNAIALSQAEGLREVLASLDVEAVVGPGMRYWHPFTVDTLRGFAEERVEGVVALSMYPHWCKATVGSSLREFRRAMRRVLPGVSFAAVECWPELDAYVDFLVERTMEALGTATAVLFSAHSVPVRVIERGDPYRAQVEETFQLARARLPEALRVELGWQSAFGPAKWLEPDSMTQLERLRADGVEEIVVVPLGFAAENIETLWDMDIALHERAMALGFRSFTRVACPNDDARVLLGLAELVADAVERIRS